MTNKEVYNLYHKELINNVIPFWERYSIDKEYGGYYTCLDRQGNVYDTDKYMWLQARQVYIFSTLYNNVEERSEWKDIAMTGADFIQKYGQNKEGDWFFALDRKGVPQVQPYNIFSDCFVALAFSALYKCVGDITYADLAVSTFERIIEKRDNPKMQYNKVHPRARKMQNFALPMILCNLVLEMEGLLPDKLKTHLIEDVKDILVNKFYDQELRIIKENVSPDGTAIDTMEGRLINPGHAIEAMWFLMDLGIKQNEKPLIALAFDRAIDMIEFGWDQEYGGIFYFMDAQNKPPSKLEWDQKLWWVHLESLVAMAKGIKYLDDPRASFWFDKLHDYTWNKFRDPEYGEWFGYLNRQGSVSIPLKGGKWKGCFHVPRALWKISNCMKDDRVDMDMTSIGSRK